MTLDIRILRFRNLCFQVFKISYRILWVWALEFHFQNSIDSWHWYSSCYFMLPFIILQGLKMSTNSEMILSLTSSWCSYISPYLRYPWQVYQAWSQRLRSSWQHWSHPWLSLVVLYLCKRCTRRPCSKQVNNSLIATTLLTNHYNQFQLSTIFILSCKQLVECSLRIIQSIPPCPKLAELSFCLFKIFLQIDSFSKVVASYSNLSNWLLDMIIVKRLCWQCVHVQYILIQRGDFI